MVSKFDNHDPSVFWMTVTDVDKIKIVLDHMKKSNTATEEYGEFLNPLVQRCSDGVLVYAGLVQYFDDTNGNKGPLSKRKLSLLFDSVAELKDCVCNLKILVEELSGIHKICKETDESYRNAYSKIHYDIWAESKGWIKEDIEKILETFNKIVDIINDIDKILLSCDSSKYKKYMKTLGNSGPLTYNPFKDLRNQVKNSDEKGKKSKKNSKNKKNKKED
ncbi:MAG: hypothetical protein Q4A26_03045 [Candidatus Saccharibacteria bacterium]|nr:hypothetical protein [Candidatus Saccharibacteria bacterium]